ncbi:phthiocerol/phthiodiolone dimycocerosyl transferase family protein [Nocardia sp. CA-107356]|uniref:phthiocerol/phthiodiolone dimycocerosyl transferase family protein n=1 Tax=Nocardia sp. CA-107356 TaxID=3239972 RepID=UPI003D918217
MSWDEEDLVRVLGASEQRFVRAGTYTGRSVMVVGDLDTTVLGAAFSALQRAYPVVTCRIAEDGTGRGYLLRPEERPVVGMTASQGDPDVVRIPDSIDPAEQLAYLDVVLSERGRSRVTLFAHHSIADAGHCVELLSRLWGYYTDYLEFGTTTVVPQDYPQSLEWHVAARGIARGSVSGFEDVTRPLEATVIPPAPAIPAPAALVRPRRIVLDEEATARIIGLGRYPDVTVNGLVTAALLRAFASGKAGATGDPVPLGCLYPVDLRTRLEPPVARAAGTNMAGLASFAAEVDLSADVLELAQRISYRLRHDLADGIVQQSVLHFPNYFGSTRIHSLVGHVAVTNTGAVPAFRIPATIALTDYEIVYVSAHPRPSAGASAAVTFLVYTFEGRLTVGLLGGGDGDQLVTAVRDELAALAEEAVNS